MNALIPIGIALIFVGFILVTMGFFLTADEGTIEGVNREIHGGGIIMIGPIPIVFGTGKIACFFRLF